MKHREAFPVEAKCLKSIGNIKEGYQDQFIFHKMTFPDNRIMVYKKNGFGDLKYAVVLENELRNYFKEIN